MLIKRILPILLSFLFLTGAILFVAGKRTQPPKNDRKMTATADEVRKPQEMRGIWVTYMTLDVENEADKEDAFKTKIDKIIKDMENAALNTMVVQIRPFSDALYPSRYYPWSHILTGTQGKDPGYDPLDYIVTQAHEHHIAVHAWLNPYRVATQNTPDELSNDNPYSKDPSIGVEVGGELYLNPASDKAQELIVNGAREIAENYDVDGIQFDDYFYPPDCGNFDSEDYERYKNTTASPLSLEKFRKENVNMMIRKVYQAVHDANPNTVFGISPQGNLDNNAGLYADVVKWCTEEGYLDYICPQIYFSLDNPALTFEDGLQDWLELKYAKDVALYIGLPAYKAGTDADSGTWLDNNDILKTEIEICREKKTGGFMLYSYDSVHNEENAEEIENVIRYLTTSPIQ